MRRALFPLLMLAACGSPRREASAPAASSAATCTAVAADLASFSEALETASADAKPRMANYAGLLELLLSFERAAVDLDAQLATLHPRDAALEKKVDAARASLGRSATFARTSLAAVEQHAKTVAPLAKDTQQAWLALRNACGPRGPADCAGVRDVVARFDGAESSADHEKAVTALAALKLSPATGKLRDRAVSASRAAHAAVRARSAETATMPQRWSDVQRDLGGAMGGLAEACKGDAQVGTELVTTPKPDPRKLTVLVHMKPPAGVERSLLSLAKAAADEDERSFYEARAEGAFGSGFFLVQRSGKGPEVLVVTNRHVVELGDRATLELADGTPLGAADVVYASPTHDLAVLRPVANVAVREGFALAGAPAKDQQTVIATGFPGLVGRPSYQTTRGYVSNESFKLDDGSRPLTYVQHTAPIDPGSSGGPLTDEAGRVLGVNTLKVTGREGVGLAVPSKYVLETLRTASAIEAKPASDRQRQARLACLGFLGELGAPEPRMGVLEQMISNHLVGTVGLEAAGALSGEEGFEHLWNADSVRAMRIATLVRVRASFLRGGGPNVLETCDDVASAAPDLVKFRVRLGTFEAREVAFRWEQGRFKVDGEGAVKGAAGAGPSRKLPPPGPPAQAPRGKKVTPPKAR